MGKVKTGDIIKLKPEYVKELNNRNEEINSLMNMIEYLSKLIRDKNKVFWDFVTEIYPETKDYVLSLDKIEGTILVKTKKEVL